MKCCHCGTTGTSLYTFGRDLHICHECYDQLNNNDEICSCDNCCTYDFKDNFRRFRGWKMCNKCFENHFHLDKNKKYKCMACRKHHSSDEIYPYNDKYICKQCLNNIGAHCKRCTTIVWKNNPNTVKINGRYYCKRCAKSYLIQCEKCNSLIDTSFKNEYKVDRNWIINKYYCNKCSKDFETCEECNSLNDIETITLFDGTKKRLCTACINNKYFKCYDCNKYYPISKKNEFNLYLYCDNCINNHAKKCNTCGHYVDKNGNNDPCDSCLEQTVINSYFHKPDPHFYSEEGQNKNIFIGVELEIQGNERYERNDFLRKVYKNKFFYFKQDGSLSCTRGVEIVSHPATYEYHCNNEWKDLFRHLNENDVNDVNNCGLHFHVNRTAFKNNISIALLDYIVNNNEHYFKQIGGREFGGYCQKHYKNEDQWGVRDSSAHCDAVNFTNENTVEIRFCKSTYDYNTFIERLSMVEKLVRFCNDNSNKKIYDVTIGDFINYKIENKN